MFDRLSHLLASVYSDHESIARVLTDAGVDAGLYDLSGSPINVWSSIVEKLRYVNGRIPSILSVLAREYSPLTEQAIALYVKELKRKGIGSGTMSFEDKARDGIYSDLRDLKANVDEINIRTTIQLSKLESEIAYMRKAIDRFEADGIKTSSAISSDRVITWATAIAIFTMIAVYFLGAL